jgi:hypothetical protein
MRNLKKLLAVVVAICVLATFTVPAFAAETTKTDAEYVAELGVLKGDGNGVDATYLAKGTTRIQAAIIYLRLLGLENEALAYSSEDNFDDAKDVAWAGGRSVLAYLKANPELGWLGIGGNKFGPNEEADAQMIYKVLLEGLGYKQGTDFEYADVITFAATKGLSKIAAVEGQINNDNLATALVEALGQKVKDGTKTLAQKLGLVKEATATAAAVGAKKLAVTFSQAVDTTKAVISVKKGTVAVNLDKTEWSEDKTVATLTTTTKITKGDYTITVKGVTEADIVLTVTAEDERVAEIKLDSDKAPRLANDGENAKKASVSYKVLNQYGESLSNIPITWTLSAKFENDLNNVLTFSSQSDSAFIPGNIVYITGVYNQGANVATLSTKVEIAMAAQADKVEFKGVYSINDKKIVDLPAGFEEDKYVLLYQVKDQYGNVMSIDNYSNLTFISNNPLFVDGTFAKYTGSEIKIDDVKYDAVKLKPGTLAKNGGSVEISAVSKFTGNKGTFSITADALASVKTFNISAPTDIIAEGEDVEIPFTAEDQYGNALTSYDSLKDVSFTPEGNGTYGLRLEKQSDGSAKLKYKAKADEGASDNNDAYVYLTSMVKGGTSVSNVMINIKETARPVAIVGIDSDVATNIAVGNIINITADKLKVQDQYGRIMEDKKINDLLDAKTIKITVSSTAGGSIWISKSASVGADVVENEVLELTSSTEKLYIKAVKNDAASEDLIFKVYGIGKDSEEKTKNADASAKSVTFTKTAQSAYKSFEIGEIGTMYNDGNATGSAIAAYDKTIKVYGVLSDGTKVELPAATDFEVDPGSDKLTKVGNVIKDVATGGYTADDFKDNTGTYKDVKVTVLVTVKDTNTDSGSALAILKQEMLLSNKAPKIDVASFDGDKVKDGKATVDCTVDQTTGGGITYKDLTDLIKADSVKDQYGAGIVGDNKTIANSDVKVTITNLTKVSGSALKVINNASTDSTKQTRIDNAKMGDKFTVTFEYRSGLTLTAEVTVGKDFE